MPGIIISSNENNYYPGGSRCQCEVYQRCPICDPDYFRQYQEDRPGAPQRAEQEEAAILDSVMSALKERLTGFEFSTEQAVDEGSGALIVKIKRCGVKNPCRINLLLEV